MLEALVENGMAKVPAGRWLASPGQPAVALDAFTVRSQRGFRVPDRARAMLVETDDDSWFADAGRPFLTRIAALPDESLNLVSSRLLVAPAECRTGAKVRRLIPMSWRNLTTVTEFRKGWAVAATKSRVTRVSLGEEETLTVRPEALVAWVGRDPTGHCPRISVVDLLLPRAPRNLAWSFHGPATVWFEGGEAPAGCLDRRRRN